MYLYNYNAVSDEILTESEVGLLCPVTFSAVGITVTVTVLGAGGTHRKLSTFSFSVEAHFRFIGLV